MQTKFYSYPQPPPEGEWEYEVDDFAILYGHTTLWPFSREDDERARADFEHGWEKRSRDNYTSPAEGTGFAAVRLAPNTKHYSWGNEYVTVFPNRDDPNKAYALLTLWVRPQGLGAIVAHGTVDLDLVAGTFSIRNDELEPEVRAQADMKATKLLAFFAAAIAERDKGTPAPTTAHDRHAVKERA